MSDIEWIFKMEPDVLNHSKFLIENDYENSTSDPTYVDDERDFPNDHDFHFKMEKGQISDLSNYELFPTTTGVKFISNDLKTVFETNAPNDVGFQEATIHDKNNEFQNCFVLIILNKIPCIDIEKSVITNWIIPNELMMFYESLRLKENCLQGHDIVRNDNYPSQIIVSNRLKQALNQFNNHLFSFKRDFELSQNNFD